MSGATTGEVGRGSSTHPSGFATLVWLATLEWQQQRPPPSRDGRDSGGGPAPHSCREGLGQENRRCTSNNRTIRCSEPVPTSGRRRGRDTESDPSQARLCESLGLACDCRRFGGSLSIQGFPVGLACPTTSALLRANSRCRKGSGRFARWHTTRVFPQRRDENTVDDRRRTRRHILHRPTVAKKGTRGVRSVGSEQQPSARQPFGEVHYSSFRLAIAVAFQLLGDGAAVYGLTPYDDGLQWSWRR